MNAAHWHLVINHIPILFPFAGSIVLLSGFFSRSEETKRAAYVLFILGALAAVLAVITGEGAEEVVEKMKGVSENYIERHEDAAKAFSVLCYLLGGLSLVTLWASFKKKSFANALAMVTLVCAAVVLVFGRQAGTTGGEIRHTEIRATKLKPSAYGRNEGGQANGNSHAGWRMLLVHGAGL